MSSQATDVEGVGCQLQDGKLLEIWGWGGQGSKQGTVPWSTSSKGRLQGNYLCSLKNYNSGGSAGFTWMLAFLKKTGMPYYLQWNTVTKSLQNTINQN